jgi:hypothetical protein
MTLNVDSVTPDISISPSDTMVRVGTPILVIWKTNGNDPASCTLTGGTLGSQNPISRDGSFNQTITGRTTFKITCGGKQDQITVDVIPDGTET